MLENEKLLPLVDAVEQATGQRPHLSTALRWATRGSKGIRLESVFLGGRRLTSEGAVHRFTRRCTEQATGCDDIVVVPPAQADRDADRAAKKLAELLEPKAKRRS
jgi:hypothetical protein